MPGESFLPLLDALEQNRSLSLISTRHESGAAFMAEADAKLCGTPAVAMGTRAVGAANLSIGVHTAFQDSTPMVVLIGQVQTSHLGREAFQEVDLPNFYSEITKWGATARSADQLLEYVDRALSVAVSGRPGPTLVAIPTDVIESAAPEMSQVTPSGPRARFGPALSTHTADAIARMLAGAKAGCVIAGGGAQGARSQLISLAEQFGLGVYSAFRRQDVFPNDHPNYCGHLTLGTPPETLRALETADVVLVVGSRLSEITTQGYRLPRPGQRVVQIDVEPASVASFIPIEMGAVADARSALETILSCAPATATATDWDDAHRAYLRSSEPPGFEEVGSPVHPAQVMSALSEVFPRNTILANDAGNFSVFAHRYWRFNEPGTQLGPTSGAMGYGVPAGVAAKLASPDRDVVVVAGDGGFLMTGQEVETGVRLGLTFTTVVFRNGLYGTIALHQARDLGRTSAVEIGDVDVAAVARGYGASAWSVESADELIPALTAARRTEGPSVVDVVVDSDVLTPTANLNELLERHPREER